MPNSLNIFILTFFSLVLAAVFFPLISANSLIESNWMFLLFLISTEFKDKHIIRGTSLLPCHCCNFLFFLSKPPPHLHSAKKNIDILCQIWSHWCISHKKMLIYQMENKNVRAAVVGIVFPFFSVNKGWNTHFLKRFIANFYPDFQSGCVKI